MTLCGTLTPPPEKLDKGNELGKGGVAADIKDACLTFCGAFDPEITAAKNIATGGTLGVALGDEAARFAAGI